MQHPHSVWVLVSMAMPLLNSDVDGPVSPFWRRQSSSVTRSQKSHPNKLGPFRVSTDIWASDFYLQGLDLTWPESWIRAIREKHVNSRFKAFLLEKLRPVWGSLRRSRTPPQTLDANLQPNLKLNLTYTWPMQNNAGNQSNYPKLVINFAFWCFCVRLPSRFGTKKKTTATHLCFACPSAKFPDFYLSFDLVKIISNFRICISAWAHQSLQIWLLFPA